MAPQVLKKELLTLDSAGRSPLLLAIQLGHQAVVERLWLGPFFCRRATENPWKDVGYMIYDMYVGNIWKKVWKNVGNIWKT